MSTERSNFWKSVLWLVLLDRDVLLSPHILWHVADVIMAWTWQFISRILNATSLLLCKYKSGRILDIYFPRNNRRYERMYTKELGFKWTKCKLLRNKIKAKVQFWKIISNIFLRWHSGSSQNILFDKKRALMRKNTNAQLSLS